MYYRWLHDVARCSSRVDPCSRRLHLWIRCGCCGDSVTWNHTTRRGHYCWCYTVRWHHTGPRKQNLLSFLKQPQHNEEHQLRLRQIYHWNMISSFTICCLFNKTCTAFHITNHLYFIHKRYIPQTKACQNM